MTVKAVWHIVKESAKSIGVVKLAPHDLRRTCAWLCHASGGELEQIQFLLGHVSVQTTERYLGCKQRIQSEVNDRINMSQTFDLLRLCAIVANSLDTRRKRKILGAKRTKPLSSSVWLFRTGRRNCCPLCLTSFAASRKPVIAARYSEVRG